MSSQLRQEGLAPLLEYFVPRILDHYGLAPPSSEVGLLCHKLVQTDTIVIDPQKMRQIQHGIEALRAYERRDTQQAIRQLRRNFQDFVRGVEELLQLFFTAAGGPREAIKTPRRKGRAAHREDEGRGTQQASSQLRREVSRGVEELLQLLFTAAERSLELVKLQERLEEEERKRDIPLAERGTWGNAAIGRRIKKLFFGSR
jgi:hypothetical protein